MNLWMEIVNPFTKGVSEVALNSMAFIHNLVLFSYSISLE